MKMATLVLAIVGAAMVSLADAAGVCYSPFHASKYFSDPSAIEQVLLQDMQQIAGSTNFTSIRTYHAQFYGQNVVEAVHAAGLQVAIGIQMVGVNGASYTYLEQDIAAAVEAATKYPDTVLAIYAGNENLINGDFGSSSADSIIKVITRVKSELQGTKGANVPVGTVQRLEEWLHAADASKVAAASDILGVNIYPFFTKGGESDMVSTLDASWSKMTAQYGAKARLTETGWPSQGSTSDQGNKATLENAEKYFAAFTQWSEQTATANPFYFMMYDLLSAQGTDYEQHFGLATASGALKFSAGLSASTSGATASNASQVSQSSSTSKANSAHSGNSGNSGDSAQSANSAHSASSAASSNQRGNSEVAGEADRSADDVSLDETPTPVVTAWAVADTSASLASSELGTDFVAGVASPFEDTPASSSSPGSSDSAFSSDSSAETPSSPPDAAASVEDAGFSSSFEGENEDVTFGSSSLDGSVSGSSFVGSSSGSSVSVNDDPDVGDLEPAPVVAPDLSIAPLTPEPTKSSSQEAEEQELRAQEAQAKRAQDISGEQGSSMLAAGAAVVFGGVAAVVVIAMYIQKNRNANENQISITTADARDSTPSVYSDPLGTRFSSIVMITPNGDGVCIL